MIRKFLCRLLIICCFTLPAAQAALQPLPASTSVKVATWNILNEADYQKYSKKSQAAGTAASNDKRRKKMGQIIESDLSGMTLIALQEAQLNPSSSQSLFADINALKQLFSPAFADIEAVEGPPLAGLIFLFDQSRYEYNPKQRIAEALPSAYQKSANPGKGYLIVHFTPKNADDLPLLAVNIHLNGGNANRLFQLDRVAEAIAKEMRSLSEPTLLLIFGDYNSDSRERKFWPADYTGPLIDKLLKHHPDLLTKTYPDMPNAERPTNNPPQLLKREIMAAFFTTLKLNDPYGNILKNAHLRASAISSMGEIANYDYIGYRLLKVNKHDRKKIKISQQVSPILIEGNTQDDKDKRQFSENILYKSLLAHDNPKLGTPPDSGRTFPSDHVFITLQLTVEKQAIPPDSALALRALQDFDEQSRLLYAVAR